MNIDSYDQQTALEVYRKLREAEIAKVEYTKANDKATALKRAWRKCEDEVRKIIANRDKNKGVPNLFDAVDSEEKPEEFVFPAYEPTLTDETYDRLALIAEDEMVAVLELPPSAESALKSRDCNCSTVQGLMDWEPAIREGGLPKSLLDLKAPQAVRMNACDIVRAVRKWIARKLQEGIE